MKTISTRLDEMRRADRAADRLRLAHAIGLRLLLVAALAALALVIGHIVTGAATRAAADIHRFEQGGASW